MSCNFYIDMDISCCDCSCGDCSNNDCSCNGTIHYNAAGVFMYLCLISEMFFNLKPMKFQTIL